MLKFVYRPISPCSVCCLCFESAWLLVLAPHIKLLPLLVIHTVTKCALPCLSFRVVRKAAETCSGPLHTKIKIQGRGVSWKKLKNKDALTNLCAFCTFLLVAKDSGKDMPAPLELAEKHLTYHWEFRACMLNRVDSRFSVCDTETQHEQQCKKMV